jgi:hypothetical protein
VRVVGLDIHRVFAEAVMLDDGKAIQLGRVGMTREHLEGQRGGPGCWNRRFRRTRWRRSRAICASTIG